MASMKQIHDFAVKWFAKFSDEHTKYEELVDHYLADDCAALAFEMDCGDAFEAVYAQASYDCDALYKIIEEVTDIPLLGSAIYSRWRYFNHWAYDAKEILERKNRSWFILALGRLAMLSSKSPSTFEGEPKKLRIVSHNIWNTSGMNPHNETEQHLTINAHGRVWLSSYEYDNEVHQYTKTKSETFLINQTAAAEVLKAASLSFGNINTQPYATDGTWRMELTNTDDEKYTCEGPLCFSFEVDGTDFSDLVRDSLDRQELYVLDGNDKPEVINKITLDYHRITKSALQKDTQNDDGDFITWDYNEQFIIDRAAETVEYIQNIAPGCKASHKYEVGQGIDELLESFNANYLFMHIQGNPPDVIEMPNERKEYTICIEYQDSNQRVITGTYDKNGLPEDFDNFAKEVLDFMQFYGLGEIFDPAIYGKARRRRTEYIFCSVVFEEGEKSYYYLTEDDSIEIGDFVLVQAGKSSHEAIVKVVNIEYFNDENAPFPIEKVKPILGKYMDDDFDDPDDEF